MRDYGGRFDFNLTSEGKAYYRAITARAEFGRDGHLKGGNLGRNAMDVRRGERPPRVVFAGSVRTGVQGRAKWRKLI